MSYLPRPFTRFNESHPEIAEAYEQLATACHQGPLDDRTRELVKLGIAIGAQAPGAVKSHTRRALALGVQPEEVEQVTVLALTTLGFPAMIGVREWVHEVLEAVD